MPRWAVMEKMVSRDVNKPLSGARNGQLGLLDYLFRPSSYVNRLNSFPNRLVANPEVTAWLAC
jgi:hypothetical protein